VDDLLYFSLDNEVENYFRTVPSQKLNVNFVGDAEWFVSMKFDWHTSSTGRTSCHLSQEGYVATIVEAMGLTHANKSPLMTPFCSGFPIDAIPHIDMSPADHAPLIKQMQSWMGMINWLQQCTRPDIATTFSLLASYMHCPSPGHLDATRYLGRYILSTMDLGLHFSCDNKATLESYIHFPIDAPTESSSVHLQTFCDANWGPQDASHLSPTNSHDISITESKSICGHIFLFWWMSYFVEDTKRILTLSIFM
jgi:hypothetical protein